jgi:hypothetical protein
VADRTLHLDRLRSIAKAAGIEPDALAPHAVLLAAVSEAARLGAMDGYRAAAGGTAAAARSALGDDQDLTLAEIAALWGCSTKTVMRIHEDPAEPFRLVKIAGEWRASLGSVRRYHRVKFSGVSRPGLSPTSRTRRLSPSSRPKL